MTRTGALKGSVLACRYGSDQESAEDADGLRNNAHSGVNPIKTRYKVVHDQRGCRQDNLPGGQQPLD